VKALPLPDRPCMVDTRAGGGKRKGIKERSKENYKEKLLACHL
jgi:hypothetical protein